MQVVFIAGGLFGAVLLLFGGTAAFGKWPAGHIQTRRPQLPLRSYAGGIALIGASLLFAATQWLSVEDPLESLSRRLLWIPAFLIGSGAMWAALLSERARKRRLGRNPPDRRRTDEFGQGA